jgi:hypothetical protein
MREFTSTYAATQPHYGTPPKTLPSSTLDLTDPVALPDADAATVLIFEQGLQHERRHLASLKARGFTVVEIPGEAFDIDERTARAEESRCGAGLR